MKIMMEETGQHSVNNNIATLDVEQRSNFFLPTLEVNRCWLPAVQPQGDIEQYRSLAKLLRNKRRLARQKKNNGCSQFARHSCIRRNSSMHSTSSGTVVAHDIISGSSFLPYMNMDKLNFVLQKELTHSDVGNGGRIVLPKRESEARLPYLDDKEGIHLTVRDVFTSYAWHMKFKFWLNNSGRVYVLEHAGAFIRKYDLKRKDFIVLYQDERNQIYICAKKTNASTSQLEPTASSRSEEVQIFMQSNGGEGKRSSGDSNANGAPTVMDGGAPTMMEVGESSAANDGLHIDTQTAEIEVDNLPELEKFPGFDEYGLSIYDLRPVDRYDVMLIR